MTRDFATMNFATGDFANSENGNGGMPSFPLAQW